MRKNTLKKDAIKYVLECWFGIGPENLVTLEQRFDRWFNPNYDPEFDQELCRKLEHYVIAARRGDFKDWALTARGCLALVLLFDQVPRNIYRGTWDAFASDHLAL
ncbi:MAG: DUF924 family protein, partial [Pseudomonadota bacterium]